MAELFRFVNYDNLHRNLCGFGVLVFGCALPPLRLSAPAPARRLLTHTTCHHTTYSHTTCHHTTCSHTTWPHTTCPHATCHHTTCSRTTWPHTTWPHTHTHRRGTWRHLPSLCMAGVALGDICLHFAWQVWHFATSTSTLRGTRGAWRHRPPLCAASVALMPLALVARLVPSGRGCLRGRRGTWRHLPSLCVAGVALMALDWLRWHAWDPFNGAVVAAAVCAAGVALGDIDRHFTW